MTNARRASAESRVLSQGVESKDEWLAGAAVLVVGENTNNGEGKKGLSVPPIRRLAVHHVRRALPLTLRTAKKHSKKGGE